MKFPQQDIWNIDELPEPVRTSVLGLDASNEQATFNSLLNSESMQAQGYALEIYAQLQSESRWGKDSPLTTFAERVRELAVRLLDSPPVAAGESGALVAEANHASALRALCAVAGQEDIGVIIRNLRASGTPLTQTRAARAALFWLQTWRGRPPELGEAMRALVENTEFTKSARYIGMRCLLAYPGPESESVLLKASKEPDMGVATNAAWVLTRLDLERHRAYLEALVATWGDDPPYLGDEVLEALGISTDSDSGE